MIEFVNRFPRLNGIATALRIVFTNHLALGKRPFFRNFRLKRERLSITLAERTNLPFCALSGACAVYSDAFLIADYVALKNYQDKLLAVVLFHNYQLLKGYCLFLFDTANIIILFQLASD